jgi:hypothetical protein
MSPDRTDADQLVVATVFSALIFALLGLAWAPALVLLHELGHALAALALTDGEVGIGLKAHAGMVTGQCTYDATRLRRPRAEAWIAAAGPAVTLVVAIVLWWATLESGFLNGAVRGVTLVLLAGAVSATGQLLLTALPLRYGAGLGVGNTDSDGRVVWRVLTGGVSGRRQAGDRPERAIHPALALVLVVVLPVAFLADVVLGLFFLLIFANAWRVQRRESPG